MIESELERRLRRALGGGNALPPRTRRWLEQSLGADLGPLRVHTDTEADRLAAALDADAVTVGADIFFRTGRYAPERAAGQWLLAHEVAHARQQATPRTRASLGGSVAAWEHAANQAATAVTHGRPGPRARQDQTAAPIVVRRTGATEPLLAQCHSSWEHRLLGDAKPADLATIARSKAGADARKLLTDLSEFLLMWSKEPDKVTEEMITKRYPYIRTLRLRTSQLLVTYGEMNTLPDYLANPTVLDDQPARTLLPILQAVRQESYAEVRRLLGERARVPFKGAVSIGIGHKMFDQLYQMRKLDELTKNLGPSGINHYTALLARNACHFAPFTWYRWEHYHTIARDLASKAYREKDANNRAEHTHRAWVNHAYADHFLQDAFASGHLINKTLVMQWFVEWAGEPGQTFVRITDWPQIMRMSALRQPGLSGPGLYDASEPGTSRDPQTAEEQPSADERMRLSGVAADPIVDRKETYQNYLAFLNSTVVQSSAAALHDYYSARSLWVSSAAHATPYEIWGDDTMLTGGDGVRVAAETAQLSQRALLDLLSTGKTSITAQRIRDRFPSKVGEAGRTRTLPQWHDDIRRQVTGEVFPKVHYNLLLAKPRIGRVSVDQPA